MFILFVSEGTTTSVYFYSSLIALRTSSTFGHVSFTPWTSSSSNSFLISLINYSPSSDKTSIILTVTNLLSSANIWIVLVNSLILVLFLGGFLPSI